MSRHRKRVGILFGGKSAEHDVSLMSAEAVYTHLDKEKFEPVLIFINKEGLWAEVDPTDFESQSFDKTASYGFLPWHSDALISRGCDIYFPVLHGPYGEDGKIQGLFELANVPFVGANALSSTLAMDKVVSNRLFESAGLNVAPFVELYRSQPLSDQLNAVENHIDYPVYVKPVSLGSSVGISKCVDQNGLKEGLALAFRYENRVIVERGLDVREIEISVMGNDTLSISEPGELIPDNQFYDYEDKYLKGKTVFHIPAKLSQQTIDNIKSAAETAFKALYLNGMSRVDFFIEKGSGNIYINEINTIPGFTEISMFPKLFQLNGISFRELISRLIGFGFDYHRP